MTKKNKAKGEVKIGGSTIGYVSDINFTKDIKEVTEICLQDAGVPIDYISGSGSHAVEFSCAKIVDKSFFKKWEDIIWGRK